MSINRGLYTSNSVEWGTPQDFFDRLNCEFHFTLDPCATDKNKKCEKYFTKEQNGLIQDWTDETVFCNPPYGREIAAWCKKCYEHSIRGGGGDAGSRQNGHRMVPRLGSQKSGDSFCQGTAAFQRKQTERSISFDGGDLQTKRREN